ncbi:MAG TPA: 16S rRNA (cytosine(1402)-N(4))-methyltransferase RsmH, partial [Pyrinomonadaceae bacterium]|nr:16S rRNA (cytosine(1402)-N(4))-methyltransferase RsmH [Pyrinomonadaceae bacterium]
MAASGGGPEAPHRPVLLSEAVELLAPERGGLFVDATLGLGGHSEAILEASPDTRVLGIDRDRDAIRLASERLARFGARFRAAHANFRDIERVLAEAGETEVSGVLADLGVSSLQFDTPERGFSFRHDAPLDMRMDATGDNETAAELLERLPEEEIARVIYEYGEERKSRRIARWIVERRERGETLKRTGELAALVARAVGYKRGDRVHPATRTFQALRIAVNGELEGLDEFVETAVDLLQARGRLAVISFHSLEDRVVKRALRRLSGHCECGRRIPVCACGARRAVEVLTRRPVVASEQELEENPRA